MTKIYIFIVFGFIVITLWGCSASIEDVKEEKAEGVTKSYPVNTDQAWEISKTVFKWEDCDEITEDRKSGYMVSELGSDLVLKETCFVGVWIDSTSVDNVDVTVVSKKKGKIQYVRAVSEDDFHESFAKGVKILKSGKKLPEKEP